MGIPKGRGNFKIYRSGKADFMQPYMILAVAIRFLVDFLLLYAASRLISPASGFVRPLLGAFVSAVYTACCLLPRLTFLQGRAWYGLGLVICCLAAFGAGRTAFSSGAVFCILRLALDGLVSGSSYITELLLGVGLCGLSLAGFGGGRFKKQYIPVELRHGGKTVRVQALYDTGHDLRDPITGKSILLVDSNVAQMLTGLNIQELQKPVDSIGRIPGLRLIPYQTVERSGQMMLAMIIQQTKIGRKKGACLVAFAPQVLDNSGKFQALIGGAV